MPALAARADRNPRLLEGGDELLGALVAVRRVLRERAHHGPLERRVDVRPQLPERLRHLVHVLQRDGDGAVAGERHPAGEHLVEDDPDRVEIRAGVDRLPLGLLRREVLRRAHDRAGLRHLRRAGAGDAEVGDLEAVVGGDDHVVRLEVTVDHAAPVREPGRVEDLDAEVDRPLLAERRLLAQEIPQSSAGQVLHRDVVGPVVLAAVVDRDHVRVLQPGGRRGLAAEALDELVVAREPTVQHLQRHLAAKVRVIREVDVGHPSRADPAPDVVPAVYDRSVGYLGHVATSPPRGAPGAPASRSEPQRSRPDRTYAPPSRRSPHAGG